MQIADAIYPLFLILCDIFFITHKLWQKTELNFVDHFCFFDDILETRCFFIGAFINIISYTFPCLIEDDYHINIGMSCLYFTVCVLSCGMKIPTLFHLI